MKKTMQIVTAVMFCLFIGGFGLLHILLPDQSFSPVENRYLSQMPTFSISKLVDGSYEAKTVPGMFPGSPDRTVVIEGPAMITFRAEGIHEPK